MTISIDMLRALLVVLERGKWDMGLQEMAQLGSLHSDLANLYKQALAEAQTKEVTGG